MHDCRAARPRRVVDHNIDLEALYGRHSQSILEPVDGFTHVYTRTKHGWYHMGGSQIASLGQLAMRQVGLAGECLGQIYSMKVSGGSPVGQSLGVKVAQALGEV